MSYSLGLEVFEELVTVLHLLVVDADVGLDVARGAGATSSLQAYPVVHSIIKSQHNHTNSRPTYPS